MSHSASLSDQNYEGTDGAVVPKIQPLSDPGAERPFWSVMVPVFDPSPRHLEQSLGSVLREGVGGDAMQIEVVDDCSPQVDVATLVKQIAGDRVAVSRTPVNQGLAGCWNACIRRSRGRWIHILHQDDYVLPGFYRTLGRAAEGHPELGLLATRSFYVDAEGVVLGVTDRLTSLEGGSREVEPFFYKTPIQCSGVVVQRSAYEELGGFRSDLNFTLDCEMWARVVGMVGGLVHSEVLSCYRKSDGNQTTKLSRTAANLEDLERFNRILAARYPGFRHGKAQRRVCRMALTQAAHYQSISDSDAARASMNYWKENAPLTLRLRRLAGAVVGSMRSR